VVDSRTVARVRSELGDVGRAVTAALTRLRGLDPREAFESAGELSDLLNGAIRDAALVRAQAAAQLRRDKHLSLAELAEELQVSRARAAQLVRAAESAHAEG
jgi:hypothetical protein